jgi:hypothetical protein
LPSTVLPLLKSRTLAHCSTISPIESRIS